MAELMDLLQGTSGQGVQQPSSAPPTIQPQAQGAAGFAERKQGWLGAFQEMMKDPANAMMLVQFGNSLANPQAGQSIPGRLTTAMADAMAYRGRLGALEQERGLTERKQAREDRRVDMEERRAGLSEQQLGLEREKLQADMDYREKALEVDRLRAQAAMVSARRPQASGATALLKQQEFELYAQAIRAENPGMTIEQARQEAARRRNEMSRDDFIKDVVERERKAHKDAMANVEIGKESTIPPFNEAEVRRSAAEAYGEDVRSRYNLGMTPQKLQAQGLAPPVSPETRGRIEFQGTAPPSAARRSSESSRRGRFRWRGGRRRPGRPERLGQSNHCRSGWRGLAAGRAFAHNGGYRRKRQDKEASLVQSLRRLSDRQGS